MHELIWKRDEYNDNTFLFLLTCQEWKKNIKKYDYYNNSPIS
jgi:hypothetical protein